MRRKEASRTGRTVSGRRTASRAQAADLRREPTVRRRTSWLEPALEAALEAIPSAAFLVDVEGDVVLANTRGRVLLDHEGAAAITRVVKGAQRGAPSPFLITPLLRDAEGHVLVVQRADAPTFDQRLERVAARYALTRAQARVLTLLARGMPNRKIATSLAISERTVEAHVTQILEKLLVESRAAAVLRALEEEPS